MSKNSLVVTSILQGRLPHGKSVRMSLRRDVAYFNGSAQAAAVHDADVGVHHDAVSVRREIAQRSLGITDQAVAVFIVVIERNGALGDDLGNGVGEGVLDVFRHMPQRSHPFAVKSWRR